MSSTRTTKRLRIFAGPNGSGKTTIINSIRNLAFGGYPIDFGIYINADEIAKSLRAGTFSFHEFEIEGISRAEFKSAALQSDLINASFTEAAFNNCFTLHQDGRLTLKTASADEHLAQIIAQFAREWLLAKEKKLSFETVFSHPSKLEFMREANRRGYKVYLYFVSTESPAINISRVKDIRIREGGHDVPAKTIERRYYRTMNLLYDAAQLAYQTFFFDNSTICLEGSAYPDPAPFAHFRLVGGNKVWDPIDPDSVPHWFIQYYSARAMH